MRLRPYQATALAGIREVWTRGGTPLLVLPTGAGKTVVFARALRDHAGPAVAIAHRKELVGQMSLTLAKENVPHHIVAPKATVKIIVRRNMRELGHSCYEPNAPVAVAGVDSLRRSNEVWRNSVTLWVMDEAHHVLRDNKWGTAVALFPNARGLGVTATPGRADGKGLGLDALGVFTEIVVGPGMRHLIGDGHLCEYKIFAPQSAIDLTGVDVSSATGDYSKAQLVAAVGRSEITGDVVKHYLRLAPGKLGVTFAVSVRAAADIAAAFNAAGVPALSVSAKTPPDERESALQRFARREILQLVNVDLFGEGFDLPAIEVVSFARPTQSFPLYCQSFGRALRPMEGKPFAIVIDHVGNVIRHGLPDYPQTMSLKSRRRRSSMDDLSRTLRTCIACLGVYPRILVSCMHCGHEPVAAAGGARSVAEVDGDLVQLDAVVLARMRNEANRRVGLPEDYADQLRARNCPDIGVRGLVKKFKNTKEAQEDLRRVMDWWRASYGTVGEREAQKLFYLRYGIDALAAHALPAKEAVALSCRVRADLPPDTQTRSLAT